MVAPAFERGAVLEKLRHVLAVEDIVAEDEGAGVAGDEALADEEGLGEAVGAGLLGVVDFEAPLLAGAEQVAEARQIEWAWR